MIDAIKARLQTGTISNVIKFGEGYPSPPYVVVKAEKEARGRTVRIIAHANESDIALLEPYIFNEVQALVYDYDFTDGNGNGFQLEDIKEWTDIIAQSDDNTYSMERVYLLPMMLY